MPYGTVRYGTVSTVCTAGTVCTVCTVYTECTVCTISQYSQYSMHSMLRMYSMYQVQYVQYVPYVHLAPITWYIVCIQMHPYATICIGHTSVCTRMPPYGSIMHHAFEIQHPCLRKSFNKHKHTESTSQSSNCVLHSQVCPSPTRYTKNVLKHKL